MGKSFRRSSPLKIGTSGRGSGEFLPPPISTEALSILILRRQAQKDFIGSSRKKENLKAGNFPKAGSKKFGIGARKK